MERIVVKYSEAFKLHVVRELETGKLSSRSEARRVYGIAGGSTVSDWVKKYGNGQDTVKIVRIEMPDEKREIQRLKEENRKLKAALTDVTISDVMNRAYFEVVCEEKGIKDVDAYKKKLSTIVSKRLEASSKKIR